MNYFEAAELFVAAELVLRMNFYVVWVRLLGFVQGYYNTGWFNPKMRSRANLLICQQIRTEWELRFRRSLLPNINHETLRTYWMGTKTY